MDVLVFIVCLITSAKAATKTINRPAYSLCVSSTQCKCSYDTENRLIVDCSGINLSAIPRLPNNTIFLSLSNNDITVVENGTFANLRQLISLDLSTNSIFQIQRDGFQGLNNLRNLNLDSNYVPLTVQGFEPGVFRSLKTLYSLSIQDVKTKANNSLYLDQIFSEVISLTSLKIDGIPSAIFGQGFSKLHNLRTLVLSSDVCKMESISNNTFAYVPFLTYLDISDCKVYRIEPGALIPLRHLQYLDISSNIALGLDGLRNASFGLINSSITTLIANKLYPELRLGVQLNSAHLEFLHQTNIKELYLDENQIELVEYDWGDFCPLAMERLSVVKNNFNYGLYILQLFKCKSLKYFYGGNPSQTPFSYAREAHHVGNEIENFPLTAKLNNYTSSSNGIKFIRHHVEKLWDIVSYCGTHNSHGTTKKFKNTKPDNQNTSLRQLNKMDQQMDETNHFGINNTTPDNQNTSLRQISKMDQHMGEANDFGIKTLNSQNISVLIFPPNMEEFHFQFADLRYEIPELNFINSSLTFINVSGNSFYRLIGPLIGFEKLKTFDISDNLCSYISDRFFESMNELESLFLANNLLGLVFLKDSDGRILGKLNNLRTLVLSNNQITSLPLQIFAGLISLRYLDISQNYLQTLDIQMDSINIFHLNVRRNLLSSLPTNIQKQLSTQANIENVTVDLTDNPFKCDCSTLKFMIFVFHERRRINFVGYDNYTCNVEDNTEQSFTNLDNLILGLEKRCANYSLVIWIVSISFALFAVVLTTGLMYRYRWKLRYMYYVSKRRYKGYSGLYESNRENYQFDAFLSYADSNLRFVRYVLLPKVETDGIHLCVHHRDFLPGEEIAANIANAIHRSRKTVVLLDDDFLSSYWCMYELNMARMESVYSRKGENILLLLVKEDVDKTKLPLELLDIIHKETYIEVPEDFVDVDTLDICGRLREAIIE